MDDILITIIELLIKEQASEDISTNSIEMIKSILANAEKNDNGWNRTVNIAEDKLIYIINEMIDNIEDGIKLDIHSIVRQITKLMLDAIDNGEEIDEQLIGSNLKDAFLPSSDPEALADDIHRLKSTINRLYIGHKAAKVAREGYRKLIREQPSKLIDLMEVIRKQREKLEELETASASSDEAIMETIDMSVSDEELDKYIESREKENKIVAVYKTGWKDYTETLQGGFRSGEAVCISALAFNFKTGLTISSFLGVLMANKPQNVKKGMKALASWVSLEDNLDNVINTMYRIIRGTEGTPLNEIDNEVANFGIGTLIRYVRDTVAKNGWSLKLDRINPTMWSFSGVFSYYNKLMSQKYDVKLAAIDYVGQIPTTGCNHNGPMGEDKRDLVRRLRNYFSAKDILWMTPWQLNSQAGALTKEGLNDLEFVEHVAGKPYYQGVSTLNTEWDLEISCHTAVVAKKKAWLTVMRGKHKLPTTLAPSKFYFALPFPPNGPIPFDFDKRKKISVRERSDIIRLTEAEDNAF